MKFYEFYYKSRLIRAVLHSFASPMHTCCCDRSWRLVGAPTTLIWVRNSFCAIVYVQNERKITHCATLGQSVGKFRPVVENHSIAHGNSFLVILQATNLFANRIYDLSFSCFSRFSLLSLLFLARSS